MALFSRSSRGVIEETLSFTIQDLQRWGFLSGEGYRSGILTLSTNDEKTGSLRIGVRLEPDGDGDIEFDYLLEGEPVKYRHGLVRILLNYGGARYYFVCRDTGTRVTALYMVDGYFSSRHHHRLVYQSSREHRSQYEQLHRSRNLEKRAGELEKHGHPRLAERMRWKAFYHEHMAYAQLARYLERLGSKVDRMGSGTERHVRSDSP